MTHPFLPLLASPTLAGTALAAPENRLRSGSFEGGTLSSQQVKAPEQTLVKDAKAGESVPHGARENKRSLRTAGLTFVAPQAGSLAPRGKASAHLWDSKNKTRKRDAQRAAEVTAIQLPRDGTPVAINVGVELTSGHELLFVPMMQGLYSNAANLTIEGLNIIPVSGP